MQYIRFLAVWVLSGLILGVVHGPAVGAFLGLAIAVGYVAAVRAPQLLAQWRLRLQRERDDSHNSPEPRMSHVAVTRTPTSSHSAFASGTHSEQHIE